MEIWLVQGGRMNIATKVEKRLRSVQFIKVKFWGVDNYRSESVLYYIDLKLKKVELSESRIWCLNDDDWHNHPCDYNHIQCTVFRLITPTRWDRALWTNDLDWFYFPIITGTLLSGAPISSYFWKLWFKHKLTHNNLISCSLHFPKTGAETIQCRVWFLKMN